MQKPSLGSTSILNGGDLPRALINPSLKILADEDYDKREQNCFGSGFMEKASKRIEAEKAMAKVTVSHHNPASTHLRRNLLTCIIFCTLARGGKGKQAVQPPEQQQESPQPQKPANYQKPS